MGVKTPIKYGVIALSGFVLTGCEPIDALINRRVDQKLSQRTTDDSAKIKELETKISSLDLEINNLKSTNTYIFGRLSNVNKESATVRDGGSYGIVQTPHGPFFVSMSKIAPHIDGYKVTLSVGNPSAASFSGGEVEVSWGLPFGTQGKTISEIFSTRKSKKFNIVRDFYSGAYTEIEVALTPAKPEEVKEIDVSLDWNIISLKRPNPQTPR